MTTRNIVVVIVTFEAGPLAQAYLRETDLRWDLLVDESWALYSAYGMERGRWWDILGPASRWTYAKLLVSGRRLRHSSGDVKQLGGYVLIDPAGVVRLHHVGAGPADRPSASSLLDVVRPTLVFRNFACKDFSPFTVVPYRWSSDA